ATRGSRAFALVWACAFLFVGGPRRGGPFHPNELADALLTGYSEAADTPVGTTEFDTYRPKIDRLLDRLTLSSAGLGPHHRRVARRSRARIRRSRWLSYRPRL